MNPLDRTDKRGSLVDLKKLMKKCLAVGMISPDCIDKMTEFQGLIDKAEDWKAEGNLCVKVGEMNYYLSRHLCLFKHICQCHFLNRKNCVNM